MQKNLGKVALVFGASGFIGSNLIRPMTLNNWRIIVVTRSPYNNNKLKMFGPPGSIDLEKVFLFDEKEIHNDEKTKCPVDGEWASLSPQEGWGGGGVWHSILIGTWVY